MLGRLGTSAFHGGGDHRLHRHGSHRQHVGDGYRHYDSMFSYSIRPGSRNRLGRKGLQTTFRESVIEPAHAANPAMTFSFHDVRKWRGLGDVRRSPAPGYEK